MPQHGIIETEAYLARREEQRQRNEEAKAKWAAHLKAEEEKQAQERQAARDKLAEQAITEYRKAARAAWLGDDKSFSAAWPELLRRWQIQQVEQQAQAEREHLLASGRYERM